MAFLHRTPILLELLLTMAYTQLKDGTILINGFKEGISDDPYTGLSDMRNVNLISVPGEASVNFKTSKVSAPPLAGSLTTTSAASNTITLTGTTQTSLEVGQAIYFSALSDTTKGITNATPYWIKSVVSTGVYTICATYPGTGTTLDITGDNVTGIWQTYNMATPKYFTKDNINTTPNNYWLVDSSGQVWSNAVTTTGSSYWIFTGNTGGSNGGKIGSGLGYYQGSDGNGWIFVFRESAIDFTNAYAQGGLLSWVYGWKPSDGSTTNANGSCGLNTPAGSSNSHECLTAPDNKFYFCDSSWIGRFYQTSRTTAFVPTNVATYTYDTTAVLPFTDTATSLAPLGNNLLIGGTKNVIYPWDTFSSLPLYPILIAENYTAKMLTINTNTFILAGNRGRIYVTNGSQAQLYKKIPDHISGTVEPYFKFGGIASTKNQLYFGAVATQNDGTSINQYGGLWAIDMDTKALRLANQLSYGSYAGYASAITPIINPPGTNNPGGTGLYVGWDTQTTTRSASNGVTTSNSASVTSQTLNFTQNDVGATISGNGIPVGTTIASVQGTATITMSNVSTVSASNVSLVVSTGYGLDGTVGQLYSSGESYVDSDLIPIGTVLNPTTQGQVEFKLSVPIVSGESIKIQYRQAFSDSFADCGTTTFNYSTYQSGEWNGYSGIYQNVVFQKSQWVQFRAVLTGTNSSPSYVRLTEIRVK